MNTLEILRMQKLAGLITEQQYRRALNEEETPEQVLKNIPDEIEQRLAKFLKMSHDELVAQALDSKKENVNEGVGLTLILVLPLLLEVAGKALNKVKTLALSKEDNVYYMQWKVFMDTAKKSKDQAKIQELEKEYRDRFGSRFGQSLIGAGHSLHKLYTWPIVQVLKLGSILPGKFGDWAKDPKQRQKIADVMYAISMLFYGGMHVKQAIEGILSVHNISDTTKFTNSVLDLAKSGKSLKDVIAAGLEIAGAASK